MDSTIVASVVSSGATLLVSIGTYILSRRKSDDTKLRFETTDYVKHLRSHQLPLKGLKKHFINSSSIEELSQGIRGLTVEKLTCEYFDPLLMKTIFLHSINNARKSINAKEFNSDGNIN